jgi:hypothetical protein
MVRHNSYSEIREILASEYRDLPDESIEALVQQSFGSASAEDIESFLSGLKKVGSVVTKALPTVLPIVGTVAGTAFGGPLGAAVGGTLGKLAGGAVQGATAGGKPRLPKPAALAKHALAGVKAVAGAVGPAGPAGSPAAAQLLGVLNRPEILQSLMAMIMGPVGRPNVPVGGNPVPLGAFANLIGSLANQAAAEYNAIAAHEGESIPTYLLNESGDFLVDPAVPEERAGLLLSMLNQAAVETDESDESDVEWDSVVYDEEDEEDSDLYIDAYYDMLELSETDENSY